MTVTWTSRKSQAKRRADREEALKRQTARLMCGRCGEVIYEGIAWDGLMAMKRHLAEVHPVAPKKKSGPKVNHDRREAKVKHAIGVISELCATTPCSQRQMLAATRAEGLSRKTTERAFARMRDEGRLQPVESGAKHPHWASM